MVPHRRPLALVAVPLLVGCARDPAEGGVVVGNPTKGMTARVLPGADVTTLDGAIDLARLRIEACDGGVRIVGEDVSLSPLGTSLVQLPEGTWCRLELELGAPLALSGATAAGGTFDLSLDVDRVRVRSDVGFSTDALLVFLLGPSGWLTGPTIGLEGEGDVVIAPGDPKHDELVALVEGSSTLGRDDDDDRRPDGEPVAHDDDDGEPLEDPADDGGGGGGGGGGDDTDTTTPHGSDARG